MSKKISRIILLASIIFACTPTKRPIKFGSDECAYCKMIISDNRFGAEVVTGKGKVYTFDSVECLAADQIKRSPEESIHSSWVIDYNQPGKLIQTASAAFLFSERIKSPMGLHLVAFAETENQIPDDEGKVMKWPEVLQLVREKWFGETGWNKQTCLPDNRKTV
jgi:copper chaperone NosL